MAKIIIPTPLRKFTNNLPSLETGGTTVNEVIGSAIEAFPELKPNLFNEQGQFRGFVRIYVGEEDILSLQKGETPVNDQSVISIIPAIAGGTR